MTELSQLNVDFARQFPVLYARELGNGEATEVKEILHALPGGLSVVVASHLPADLLSNLARRDDFQIGVRMEHATLDQASALLNRLPRDRCLMFIEQVRDQRKRRKLLRFLNYPKHSVGSMVSHAALRFNTEDAIGLIMDALRASDLDKEPAIVVATSDGRYAGVLDGWRLLSASEPEGEAGNYMTVVRPLRAESNQARALNQPEWRDRNWLPVVDHQDRILGLCWRAVLENAAAESSDVKANPMDNFTSLGAGYVSVMGSLLNMLFGGRKS